MTFSDVDVYAYKIVCPAFDLKYCASFSTSVENCMRLGLNVYVVFLVIYERFITYFAFLPTACLGVV